MFSLNAYKSWTLYEISMCNIHMRMVFRPYGFDDAPAIKKKHRDIEKLLALKFSSSEKTERKILYEPHSLQQIEILFRKNRIQMVLPPIPYGIPCVFLNLIFSEMLFHIRCIYVDIPCEWFDVIAMNLSICNCKDEILEF